MSDGFPPGIGAPATRALVAAGYRSTRDLAGVPAAELLALHGVGPKAVRLIEAALAEVGTAGVVRFWHDDQGWGVIDSADTPDGCWAHFSVVEGEAFRRLEAGQAVRLVWEAADQDGYAFRAVSVRP